MQKPVFVLPEDKVLESPLLFFFYPDGVSLDLLCGKCSLPLSKPMSCDCGNLYCQKCIKNMKGCPGGCARGTLKICNTRFLLKALEELCVVCLECGKEVQRRDIVEHLNKDCDVVCPNGCDGERKFKRMDLGEHWMICENAPVQCLNENCTMVLKRKECKVHDERCYYKMVACEYCKRIFRRGEMEEHIKVCEEFEMKCEICGMVCRRKEMKGHEDVCEERVVHCAGCEFETKRRNIEKHKGTCPFVKIRATIDDLQSKYQNTLLQLRIMKIELQSTQKELQSNQQQLQKYIQKEMMSLKYNHLKDSSSPLKVVHLDPSLQGQQNAT